MRLRVYKDVFMLKLEFVRLREKIYILCLNKK